MKKHIFVFVGFIIFLSCKEKLDSKAASPTVIQEETVQENVYTVEEIYRLAEAKSIEDTFAEEDLLETKQWIEEGSMEVVTLKVYPNTPKELLINYTDINKSIVHSIEVYAYDSPWKSETGIYMGMPLSELEALNKKSLRFYGYEWDYAGAVDFEKGALASEILFVYLGTDGDVDMPKEFIGSDITITAEQAKKYNIDFKVTGLMYRPKK